VEGAVEGGIGD
jgi:hypothetical protein